MTSNSWTFVQICGAVGLICSIWNLFGDLYFLDFYTANMNLEKFGMIQNDIQSSYLFQFDQNNWWIVLIAQSGGWMYPIWAFATCVPIYMGLLSKISGENFPVTSSWKTIAPCVLLVYGLCIMGGGLHSAFAFVSALPSVYHYYGEWTNDLVGNQEFAEFLETTQTRIVQHFFFGFLPGYVACTVASIWIAVLVYFHDTKFPRSFNYFNPIFTMFWVQILGALLPETIGFYLVGCLGTWSVLMLNIGTTYYLWNESVALVSPSNLLLLQNEMENDGHSAVTDYNSFTQTEMITSNSVI